MGCGNDAENSVKGGRFWRPSYGYAVTDGSRRVWELTFVALRLPGSTVALICGCFLTFGKTPEQWASYPLRWKMLRRDTAKCAGDVEIGFLNDPTYFSLWT